MDLRDYTTGTRLCLDIHDEMGTRIEREFISQFEEALNEFEAYIAIPIVEGVVYAVRVGWKIVVYMHEKNTLFRFYASVTERKIENGRHLMKIVRTSEIDQAQRRKYYRFACSLPVKYRVIEGEYDDMNKAFKDGVTADLSGGGMCLRLHEILEVDTIIECRVVFGYDDLSLIGHIVKLFDRELNLSDPAIYEHEVGILFSDITEHDRDIIVKFIFDEQLRQIQRRMENSGGSGI